MHLFPPFFLCFFWACLAALLMFWFLSILQLFVIFSPKSLPLHFVCFAAFSICCFLLKLQCTIIFSPAWDKLAKCHVRLICKFELKTLWATPFIPWPGDVCWFDYFLARTECLSVAAVCFAYCHNTIKHLEGFSPCNGLYADYQMIYIISQLFNIYIIVFH